MKAIIKYLWDLGCWFVRHTVLIIFALMVFSMFVGAIFYLGYSLGYEFGMMDAIQFFEGPTQYEA